MKLGVCFDDVLLSPRYSDIKSRKEIDLTSEVPNLGTHKFSLPIVSSPMDTVTGTSMAVQISSQGGLGIIHRYNTVDQQSQAVYSAKNAGCPVVGAAVGVSGDFLRRARALAKSGADVICVDIAHGHHVMMKDALHALREDPYVGDLHIMAGNVATLEAFNDLSDWGANSIRVGIGGGSICSTRIQTGHGMPTLQSVIECSRSDRDAALIADGGIRTSGDIVKALSAGADLVMLGSLLAGTDESPGEVIEKPELINGRQAYIKHKVYRGMASVEAQIDWRGHTSSEEGVSSTVSYKGSVGDVLDRLEKGIRSGLSYSGCRTLSDFRTKSTFMRQTSNGVVESSTHVNQL